MSFQHVVWCFLRCVESLNVAVYHECSLLCLSTHKSTRTLVKIGCNLKHHLEATNNTYSTFKFLNTACKRSLLDIALHKQFQFQKGKYASPYHLMSTFNVPSKSLNFHLPKKETMKSSNVLPSKANMSLTTLYVSIQCSISHCRPTVMHGLAFWKHHYFTDLIDSKDMKIFPSEYAVKARLCGILGG